MLDDAIPTTQFGFKTKWSSREDGSIIEEKMFVRKFAREFFGKLLGTTHCHRYISQKEIYLFILPLFSFRNPSSNSSLFRTAFLFIAEFLSRHKGGT
jgi:hypothetical protein